MALSLMLRNAHKIKGFTTLPRCTIQINQSQKFSHMVLKNKNMSMLFLANKCKVPFINAAQQTKRSMSSDHSKMWTIEKLVSLVLLGIVPATFLSPNKVLDNIFAVAVVMHFHWGLEACVIDYVRPIIVGPVLPKLALILLYVVSASTLAGLLYFNQTQIGIGEAFRRFWCISGTSADNDPPKE